MKGQSHSLGAYDGTDLTQGKRFDSVPPDGCHEHP